MKYSKRNIKNHRQNHSQNKSCKVGGDIFNHSLNFICNDKDFFLLKKSFGRGYTFNDNKFSNLNKLIEHFKKNYKSRE